MSYLRTNLGCIPARADPRHGRPPGCWHGEPDAINERSPVIIAGFGEFGATVGRMLWANGVKATVLDLDSDRHELARSRGDSNVYLSATRQRIEDLERIVLVDRGEPDLERDSGWNPESLHEEAHLSIE